MKGLKKATSEWVVSHLKAEDPTNDVSKGKQTKNEKVG